MAENDQYLRFSHGGYQIEVGEDSKGYRTALVSSQQGTAHFSLGVNVRDALERVLGPEMARDVLTGREEPELFP